MGRLPRRSTSALTATVLTVVAIAQPLLSAGQAAMAQDIDPAREIEFIPQEGNEVITAPQGSFGRGGRATVQPSSPTSTTTDDAPVATSTFSADRPQVDPNPSVGAGAAAVPNPSGGNVPPANPATNSPAVSQIEVPLPPQSAPPVANAPEPLPPIPIPAQPVTPQPAPNVTSGAPQADIPTSYDYRRPTENLPSSPTFVARGQLPAGTVIPVATFRDTKFDLQQQLQVNLSVTDNVTDGQGRTIIPAGSTVWGRFEPLTEEKTDMVGSFERTRKIMVGSQFVAERIDIQSASHTVSGRSNNIPAGIDPDADVDRIALRNAGYGVLGGVALGVLTGGAGFLPLMAIGGAGGAMAGTVSVSNVVAIDGDTVLELTLDQPFISN